MTETIQPSDYVIKDVLLHGFIADQSTCSEAELRFLIQQKTDIQDQWKMSKRELLKRLHRNIDKIDRVDIEKIVQEPDEDEDTDGIYDIQEVDEEEEYESEKEIINSPSLTNINDTTNPDNISLANSSSTNNEKPTPLKVPSKDKTFLRGFKKFFDGEKKPVIIPEKSNEEKIEDLVVRMNNLEEHYNTEMALIKTQITELQSQMATKTLDKKNSEGSLSGN